MQLSQLFSLALLRHFLLTRFVSFTHSHLSFLNNQCSLCFACFYSKFPSPPVLMDNRILFSDSDDLDISGGSSTVCCANSPPPDVVSLTRLSESLESIFFSDSPTPDFDFFADARIFVAGGKDIPVHRCVLSARSPFFREFFAGMKGVRNTRVELKDLMKEYDVGFDAVVTVLAYLYSGRVRPPPKNVCVCVDDECPHEACRPIVQFLVEVLLVSFTFQIPELVAKYQKKLLDLLNNAAADDILIILSLASICGRACDKLVDESIEIIVKSDVDIVTLEKSLSRDIVKRITEGRLDIGLQGPEHSSFLDKHVKRIHRALDSDDVELVRMLLKESQSSLDDAYALHYAVAYCDAKTTTELLDLSLADVNHTDARGFTVLHVAAMRKEPKIIVSLLTKGARPSDKTLDGRKALQIAKRLTRAVDYERPPEEGTSSSKDRLCIEILEQAERRDPLLGEASVSLAIAGDALRMKLLYLENRVGLAKLLFPMEAKVTMDIAQVDGTSEFPLAGIQKNVVNAQRTTVDLNEAPFKIQEEHLNRLRALSRTVELGKRFFPRCSEALNNIMDGDDLSEMAAAGNDTPEERQRKKQRYTELQDVLSKAFKEDKQEFERVNNVLGSSSSTSMAPPPMKATGNFIF